MTNELSARFAGPEPSAEFREAVAALAKLPEVDRERACAEALFREREARVLDRYGRSAGGSWTWRQLVRGKQVGSFRGDPCYITMPGQDHSRLHTHRERGPTYITQPYQLSLDTLREVVAECDRRNLDCTIDGNSSWFPGRTIRMVYTPKDPPARYRRP